MTAAPPLGALVRAGEKQTEAVAIRDGLWMVRDLSNAYLLCTADGDLMVNTGFMDSAERNAALLAPHRQGPLRRIILTQSHADHFGGVPALREPGTEIIAGQGFIENARDMLDLMPFFGPRTRRIWGATIPRKPAAGGAPLMPPVIVPDRLVAGRHDFEQGGRQFALLATPGGETTDSISVWLPEDGAVFTGNLFGPMFRSMPFLNTLRGDKPRSVRSYLASLATVRALDPDLLITGHGDPILGAARIRADLDRMHDAVAWVRDETLAGMKAGKDMHRLMREIRLPEALAIGEFHGNVRWAVKAIWHEYAGWFQQESTTELYGVPRCAVSADLVALAGGPDPVVTRAGERLAAGEPLEAIHLLEIALAAAPGDRGALLALKTAHEALLAASGGTNLSETGWLRTSIAAIDAQLADA